MRDKTESFHTLHYFATEALLILHSSVVQFAKKKMRKIFVNLKRRSTRLYEIFFWLWWRTDRISASLNVRCKSTQRRFAEKNSQISCSPWSDEKQTHHTRFLLSLSSGAWVQTLDYTATVVSLFFSKYLLRGKERILLLVNAVNGNEKMYVKQKSNIIWTKQKTKNRTDSLLKICDDVF